jgi:hypothetical protein
VLRARLARGCLLHKEGPNRLIQAGKRLALLTSYSVLIPIGFLVSEIFL